MKTYKQEVKVGIWEVAFTARVYKDKITASFQHVQWKNNSGTLSRVKRITLKDAGMVKAWAESFLKGECSIAEFVDEMHNRLMYAGYSGTKDNRITMR